MGSDERPVEEVRAAGERRERVLALPLWEDYRELIKSDIADVKNSGGRPPAASRPVGFCASRGWIPLVSPGHRRHGVDRPGRAYPG